MLAIPCPDRATLERLMLGHLAPAEADPIAQHLLHCDRCAEAIRGREVRVQPASRDLGVIPSVSRSSVDAPTLALIDCLAPPQEPGELGRLGGYRILQVLGSGGMAAVFHAEDLRLGREVALKVLKPAMAASNVARRRFLREARSMASLEHDHIVAVYQVDEDRGLPFLAMPLLKGESLLERLRRQKQITPTWLPIDEVMRIGHEIAEGLAAAHERGLIHRDIKPANIWLETKIGSTRKPLSAPNPRVKLLDFGIVRVADDDQRLTAAGVPVGTPAFMAPEQAFGDAIDHRCDLFSLGCVLYRMATGQLAFNGPNPQSIINALKHTEPAPPRDLNSALPPALAALIRQLLSKDREQRPQSAADVADALRSIGLSMAAIGLTIDKPSLKPAPKPPLDLGSDGLPKEGAAFGRYKVLRRLGRGTMGTVFLAADSKIERQVALKIPHILSDDSKSADLARFQQEARAAGRLSHRNICPIYDFGEIDGITYATMAYVEGGTLFERMQGERMAPAEAIKLIQSLARAMGHAHRHGVIHRDLKPANVMLDRSGAPIIMDFGLGRRTDAPGARLTTFGETLGTPAYMAPEQLLGELDDIGPRSDIYSLGVILYETLTGRRPIDGELAVLVGKLLNEEPPPVSEHAPSLRGKRIDGILRKALAKKPGDRFVSMEAFAEALELSMKSEPESALSAPPPPNSAARTTDVSIVGQATPAERMWKSSDDKRSGTSMGIKLLMIVAVAIAIAAAVFRFVIS